MFRRGSAAAALDDADFAFPEARDPSWTQVWHAVVGHVVVAQDDLNVTRLLDRFSHGDGVRTLGFVNAHAMNSCAGDPRFAADLLAIDYLVRDGVGVHTLYKLIGSHAGLNLNGTDLLPHVIPRFAGKRIAVFGTRLPLAQRVAEKLRVEHGCETISADGFHTDGYYLDLVARHRPDLVILGMGMPKQERVARLMKQALRQDTAVVCGGAILDFLSGQVRRAPLWVRRCGLEWMFRLSLEPRRLFRRYIIGNPLFLLRSAILARRGKPDAEPVVTPPPAPRTSAQPFGIGGPLPSATLTRLNPVATPTQRREPGRILPFEPAAPRPAVALVPPRAAAFSANRPVVDRDALYGRRADLERLQTRVLDQGGSAMLYGPRGYGKTSLVRVFGEVADSLGHLVIYASCSRGVDFQTLLRQYLTELATELKTAPPPGGPLSVQAVAASLAQVQDRSVVLIFDEFDRIDSDATREALVELIKDVSDLTASVRFLLVGVATDAQHILGYHPSVHRCLSCVPLARVGDDAIEKMFHDKAAADGLTLASPLLGAIVSLAAGSAYHAQLIGQKLAALVRRTGTVPDAADLTAVLTEIVEDARRIDPAFARLVAELAANPQLRTGVLRLARQALTDPEDMARTATVRAAGLTDLAARLELLGTLAAAEGGWRFTDAFTPQLVLFLMHRDAARAA